MFFALSQAWDKENILSPHEESNLKPSDSVLVLNPKSINLHVPKDAS